MSRIFNRLRIIFDSSINCGNILDKAAEFHPSSTLFHTSDALPYKFLAETEMDLCSILKFVNRVGNLLLANGLQQYDRVAIFKTNNIDYFFLALAVVKAGGIAVPINSGMRVENLEYYLNNVGAKFVFTDTSVFHLTGIDLNTFKGDYIWLFPDLPDCPPTQSIDINASVTSMSDQLPVRCIWPDTLILIVHTSGTTGFPKGVMCTSGGLMTAIKGHYKSEPIHRGNRIAIAGHYNHLVYYVGFLTSMLANMETWILPPDNSERIFETIGKENINIFFGFPDVYLRMYEKGLAHYNLETVKVWVSTADASHSVHIHAFIRAGAFLRLFGKKIISAVFIDVIGTSEVGSGALRRIVLPFTKQSENRCVGRPFLGGPKVKIADKTGRTLRWGIPGRLMVKGPTLFKGYWNAHETSLGTTYDNWWWTGDWVVKDFTGCYYHLDRYGDRIKTPTGIMNSLVVEEYLLKHPKVLEAVVIGVLGKDRVQIPIAIIAPFVENTLDEQEMLDWANQNIVSDIPLQKIYILPAREIPRGLTGKVLKRVLREKYQNV